MGIMYPCLYDKKLYTCIYIFFILKFIQNKVTIFLLFLYCEHISLYDINHNIY